MDWRSSFGPIVSATWLNEQLKQLPDDLKILDSSSTPLKGGRDDFLSSHIPGAQFFDLLECMTPMPLIPRNLPDQACLQEYVRSLGVNKEDYVIVYDRGALYASCRAWWTFRALGHTRVAVLDGGMMKWEAEQFKTESGPAAATPKKGNCELKRDDSLISCYEDIINAVTNKSCQIVDARFEINFRGEEEEPARATRDAMKGLGLPQPTDLRKGHVKGAINLMDEKVFDPNLWSKYKIFLDKDKLPNSNKSCVLALAAYLCGKKDVASYYGSWTEFGQRAGDDLITAPHGCD